MPVTAHGCADKVLNIQKRVIGLCHEHNYILSQIENAGYNPVWFDSPKNSTLEMKVKKKSVVRTTGRRRQECTVMLRVTVERQELALYVVLKWKKIPNDAFPKGIVDRAKEKGWMNHELAHNWVKSISQKHLGTMLAKRSLILESFRNLDE